MKFLNNINTYIQYQDGSVVSKEIVSKPTGTITLFAFDKEQGLSEHTAPYEVLIMITDGKAEVTVNTQKHELIEGEILLIPAKSRHALKAIEPFKMLLVMIKSE